MICPACQTPNDEDARFCKACGARLSQPEPPAPPETAEPVEEDVPQPHVDLRPLAGNPVQPRRSAQVYTPERHARVMPAQPARLNAAQEPRAAAKPEKARKRDEVFLFDDEREPEEDDDWTEGVFDEDEDAPRRGPSFKVGLITLAVFLLLVAGGAYYVFGTSDGARLRASVNFAADAGDYLLLADARVASGDLSGAQEAYYSAFRRSSGDYDACLRVGDGFLRCGATERLQQLYLYMIQELDPKREEAYGRLLEVYKGMGMTNEYDKLQNLKAVNLGLSEGELAAPYGSVAGGAYNQSVQLSLTAQQGAAIYYTVDGSLPNEYANRYTGAIVLDEGVYVVRAVAMLNGTKSEEWMATYQIAADEGQTPGAPDAPAFSPASGKYEAGTLVRLTAGEGCLIYYTTGGDTPTPESARYADPLALTAGQTLLRAVAVNASGEMSAVVSALYEVGE